MATGTAWIERLMPPAVTGAIGAATLGFDHGSIAPQAGDSGPCVDAGDLLVLEETLADNVVEYDVLPIAVRRVVDGFGSNPRLLDGYFGAALGIAVLGLLTSFIGLFVASTRIVLALARRSDMILVKGLAVIFIYLVVASQFGSLLPPGGGFISPELIVQSAAWPGFGPNSTPLKMKVLAKS